MSQAFKGRIWGIVLLALILQLSIPTNTAKAQSDCTFTLPYVTYGITGGIHGDGWYVNGQKNSLAVDIGAGVGTPLLSPIVGGVVVDTGIDPYLGYNNTYIIIENTCWKVFLLHGIYTAPVGTTLSLGEQFGTEASIGNSSGPHTHLSLYDKINARWVNPISAGGGASSQVGLIVSSSNSQYAVPTPVFANLGSSPNGGGFPIGNGVPVYPEELDEASMNTSSNPDEPRGFEIYLKPEVKYWIAQLSPWVITGLFVYYIVRYINGPISVSNHKQIPRRRK